MKKIIFWFVIFLVLISPTLALQQVAGPLVINVALGQTNSTKYVLLNDENESVLVALRAEGDVAQYISFPSQVTINPGEYSYVDISASLPEDYSGSTSIAGNLIALKEGSPGQVRLNIELKKSITILAILPPQQTPQTTNPTGLFFLQQITIPLLFFIILIIGFAIYKKWR